QREREVALIVRGHGHDRARSVSDQDVVGDPDRNLLTVDRVDRERAGGNTGLLPFGRETVDLRLLARALGVRLDLRAVLRRRDARDQRMLRREHQPLMTCSLASTVLSTGHQFTGDIARYASPRS